MQQISTQTTFQKLIAFRILKHIPLRRLFRISIAALIVFLSLSTLYAQDTSKPALPDTTGPRSVDPKLLEWQSARIPKEYSIGSINITGIRHLDTAIVLSI